MIGIVESARRAVQARDRARTLFETVGRWVPTEADPGAKLVLAKWSRRHAGHAELWDRVVPVLHDVALDGTAGDGEAGRIALGTAAPGRTEARLEAYAAELEAYAAELGAWEADAVAESDGPALRVVGIVRADLAAALHEVGTVRQGVGHGVEGVDAP